MINGQDKGEAALVAIDPASGGCACSWADASTPTRRLTARWGATHPGSAFKPFVYLTALAEGVVNPRV